MYNMQQDDQQQDDQSMSPASRKLKDHLDQRSVSHHLSSLERSISGLGRQFVVQNACLGDLSESMESGFKSLETRINKQEQRIKDLSGDMDVRCSAQPEDMSASFKLVVECHMSLEDQINARFNLVDTRLDQVEAAIASVKEDLKNDMVAMEGRIKEDLKNDLAAMESRILDKLKQGFLATNA